LSKAFDAGFECASVDECSQAIRSLCRAIAGVSSVVAQERIERLQIAQQWQYSAGATVDAEKIAKDLAALVTVRPRPPESPVV